MGTLTVTKIVLKSLGDPKTARALMPDGVNEVLTGSLIGIVTGKKKAKGQDGVTEMFGLRGSFEAIPSDPEKDTLVSGVCWLPDAFMEPIFMALDRMAEEGNERPEIQIAGEVFVRRDTNPQGYSWGFRAVREPERADPLAELRKAVEERAAKLKEAETKQLENKTIDPVAVQTLEKGKGKPKAA